MYLRSILTNTLMGSWRLNPTPLNLSLPKRIMTLFVEKLWFVVSVMTIHSIFRVALYPGGEGSDICGLALMLVISRCASRGSASYPLLYTIASVVFVANPPPLPLVYSRPSGCSWESVMPGKCWSYGSFVLQFASLCCGSTLKSGVCVCFSAFHTVEKMRENLSLLIYLFIFCLKYSSVFRFFIIHVFLLPAHLCKFRLFIFSFSFQDCF